MRAPALRVRAPSRASRTLRAWVSRAGLALAAAAAIAATPAAAQGPAVAPTASAAAASSPAPALWVVRDADTTIHLFGTVHVLPPGLAWLSADVRAAFDRSDALVLELVLPAQQEVQGRVLQRALAPGVPPVAARLPERLRAPYAASLASLGIPADAFDPFHSWFVATALAMAVAERSGLGPAHAPEAVLGALAATAGKPVSGLETFDEQLDLFAAMPEPERFLATTVEQLPAATAVLASMVAAWSRGDADALAAILDEGFRDLPEVEAWLMTRRNARWAAWIRERLRTPGTVFVAVGAGHLAGPGSVQAALERLGLRAERLAPAP